MRSNVLYWIVFSVSLAGCGGAQTRPAPVLSVTAQGAPEGHPKVQRGEALLQALLALGVEYRSGGHSPVRGFDCSGLVAHVFREAYGMHLPHSTRAQSELGAPVAFSELEPGDLVFYNTLDRPFSHVGIYLGEQRFVHAPKAGSSVRVESIRSAYWSNRFDGARRINPPI